MIMLYMVFSDPRGEDGKFECIYTKYKDKMIRIAESVLHNFQDAEDAVQIAFIAVAKHLRKLADPSSRATEIYVCKCARTAALNILSSKSRQAQLLCLEDQRNLPDPSDDDALSRYVAEENYTIILEAIKALPETYRDVLTLYYVNELKPREIASSFNKPVETVKSQIKRGKQILCIELKERLK